MNKMLVPASVYKDAIEKQFNQIQYTDKYLWYTGSIDNFDLEVKTEGDKFAFAIVESCQVIGYVSFRVDWYCSMAYNFSLIKFLPIYFDNLTEEYKSSTKIMMSAIREVIRQVESFNLHRIDFRCVQGNPAERSYWRILKIIDMKKKYDIRHLIFSDNIRDRYGKYHDTICFELVRKYISGGDYEQ